MRLLLCLAIFSLGFQAALAHEPAAPAKAPQLAAQEDPSQKVIPSIELEGADIREALKLLFRTVGASYSVANDVQGNVTANLKDVRFEVVLQNILRQVDATYRVEGGVYSIIRRPTELEPGEADEPAITLSFQKADLAEVLAKVVSAVGASYVISPEVRGEFTGDFKGTPFFVALQSILEGTPYRVLINAGIYRFDAKDSTFEGFEVRSRLINGEFDQVDVRQLVKALFATGINDEDIYPNGPGDVEPRLNSFVLESGVTGKVTGSIKGLTLDEALEAILAPIGARAVKTKGYYLIKRAASPK